MPIIIMIITTSAGVEAGAKARQASVVFMCIIIEHPSVPPTQNVLNVN